MASVTYKQFEQLSFGDIEVYSVLPVHPIWSRAEQLLDFSFADRICAPLYTSRGARPYAPSLKLKLHIVQRYYNLSDREMEERVIGDLFIKRFLGLPVRFIGFDHSTIGLDRERMGSELFSACHHHILAQARQMGLWGDNRNVWLVDSFHTNGHIVRPTAFRLIKKAILRLLSQLKRANRSLYNGFISVCDVEELKAKLPSKPTQAELEVAFSKLVILAYNVLYGFESETIQPLFWSWANSKRQLASLELQAFLYRILNENTYADSSDDSDAAYKKKARKDRPKDRLVSTIDPDVRAGYKNIRTPFLGDKIQVVVEADSWLVLDAEPIAGNEDDGQRLLELIEAVCQEHHVRPNAIAADSAYGYGSHRRALEKEIIPFASPLKKVGDNPTGLFSNEQFKYDADVKAVRCPADQVTSKYSRLEKENGVQYRFPKATCQVCPLLDQCTTNKGRTIFISDFYDEFQRAKAFNATERGKELLTLRSRIEPKNHEMKNHNGLGHARARTREKRRSSVKIVCMVVNMKQIVKQLGSITLGFSRTRPHPQGPRLSIST